MQIPSRMTSDDDRSSPPPSPAQPQPALDPTDIIAQRFADALASLGPGLAGADPMVTQSKRAELGDFQCNAAMPLAKRLGRNPRDLAGELIGAVRIDDIAEPIDASAIAGPGFINIRLRADALASLLTSLDTPGLGVEPPAAPATVVVDLCGVNLAKQMHAGHIRSMVIGDAIARSFERLGWRVVRQNHVGDWGLPIAMVATRLMRDADRGAIDPDDITLDDLDRLYREAREECAADHQRLARWRKWMEHPKANAEFEAEFEAVRLEVEQADANMRRAKETLVALQSGEPRVLGIWKRISDVTLRECLSACERLHVRVHAEDSAGESSYAEELPAIVEDLLARGVAEQSDGAVVVRLESEGMDQPCLVRKSDGGYLYATTDLAAIRRRVGKFGAGLVVYCVDARQALHFKQVFAAAKRAGYADLPTGGVARLEHASFGMILGEDHRPFKTRSGENVKLSALIDEAMQRAGVVVAEKNPGLTADQREPISGAVAVAALKYADLTGDRTKDYVFSFDRMLAFEGDTGPYLLYALVRVRSILRKAVERGLGENWRSAPLRIEHPAERALALTLLRYPTTLRAVGEHLEPHRLCAYLQEVATAFSSFFDACPVLATEDEAIRSSRLRLCHLAGRVLDDGLTTLGIPTLDRM